jgi:hypothetical protein
MPLQLTISLHHRSAEFKAVGSPASKLRPSQVPGALHPFCITTRSKSPPNPSPAKKLPWTGALYPLNALSVLCSDSAACTVQGLVHCTHT